MEGKTQTPESILKEAFAGKICKLRDKVVLPRRKVHLQAWRRSIFTLQPLNVNNKNTELNRQRGTHIT